MRRAHSEDIPLLITLMTPFYGESGYELDPVLAEEGFASLLADERLGRVWVIEADGQDVGYVVLTLRFGMEYGGMMASIDDLYVLPAYRNRGLSRVALESVRDYCKAGGVRAITVEVGYENGPAQAVYRRLGMVEEPGRQLLVLALADPSHRV